jgi:hypothetical protein
VVAALGGCGGSHALRSLGRSTHDRADDITGLQIHFVYAVPSGRPQLDHHRDVDTSLANSVFLIASWFHQQRGKPLLRIDTYHGQPDITFIRLPRSNATYKDSGPRALMEDLARAGFDRDDKAYAVYYDGTLPTAETCGLGGSPPHPYAIAFVAQECFTDYDFTQAELGSYSRLVFVMAHEIVHELGFVPDCAPHSTGTGHVDDSSHDLMFPVLQNDVPVLDVHNDDYYLAHVRGCEDLSKSPFLVAGGRLHIRP